MRVHPGTRPANVTGIQFAVRNVQDFAVTDNTSGTALAPYTTCGVAFHFAPKAVGERGTSLVFNDDAYGNTQVVSVSGSGSSSYLQFTSLTWQFPTRRVGETSGSYVAYVYNNGNQTVHWNGIYLRGNNMQDFAITRNTCGATLLPYTTCGVAFNFAPTAPGERSAELVFDASDNRGSALEVSGYAIAK